MTIGRIPSVEGGIQPTIVTAKGDLIVATGNATLTRQPVGSDGQVLVADSTQADGVAWQSVATPFAAGKNKILNSDFSIWQRGTSFTTGNAYTADRWFIACNATFTASRQTFTPGTAPVAGYEGQFFYRIDKSAGGSFAVVAQRVEDVRTFAGQTVTISFWAKVGSGTVTIEPYVSQSFGSGGSADVGGATSTVTATTSWQRFSIQYAVPSVSGKTIGTSSFIEFSIGRVVTSSAFVLDIWGVQVEAGSVATPFQTATGTLQGELAACQRYYWKPNSTGTNLFFAGFNNSTTEAYSSIKLPVTMRARPTVTITNAGSNLAVRVAGGSNASVTGSSVIGNAPDVVWLALTGASGLTSGQGSALVNLSSSEPIEMSAEL